MKIIKPICFFDLETTSTDPEVARIVEIAAIKINLDGNRETKHTLINPEIPIPPECSEIHGITDEMVTGKPTFRQIAVSLREWFKDCDLGGFNSNNYDIVLLSAELNRAGLEPIDWSPDLLDILVLYRHLFPNTLSDVYKRLTGKELEGAHGALNDILSTIEVAEILIETIEEKTVRDIDLRLQGDKTRVDLAGKLYKDSEGVVRYAFGKDKDKSVKDNPGFGNWMLSNSFPAETKNKLREILK